MATAPFNYGTRIIRAGSEPRPIEVADVSTVARGFAASDASNSIFPLNEPVTFFTHEADKIAALGAHRHHKVRRRLAVFSKRRVRITRPCNHTRVLPRQSLRCSRCQIGL